MLRVNLAEYRAVHTNRMAPGQLDLTPKGLAHNEDTKLFPLAVQRASNAHVDAPDGPRTLTHGSRRQSCDSQSCECDAGGGGDLDVGGSPLPPAEAAHMAAAALAATSGAKPTTASAGRRRSSLSLQTCADAGGGRGASVRFRTPASTHSSHSVKLCIGRSGGSVSTGSVCGNAEREPRARRPSAVAAADEKDYTQGNLMQRLERWSMSKASRTP
eukprot:362004-Chlamydomonas_euryale.AAC.11